MCQTSNSAIDGAMASHMAYYGNQEDD